jgi:hypothetical protein
MKTTVSLPMMQRQGDLAPGSFRAEDNAVDCVWTTGATVRRAKFDWNDGLQEYDEQLIVGASAVRLDRLNSGAPFLDTHGSWSLASVIGCVIPGSARLENGRGLARVQLSRAPADAAAVQKIADGIIRNVSVGYKIHTVERIEKSGQVPLVRVVDWEPMELSAVPMGADPGAGMRAGGAEPGALFDCRIVVPDRESGSTKGRLTAPVLAALRRMNLQGRLFRVSHR